MTVNKELIRVAGALRGNFSDRRSTNISQDPTMHKSTIQALTGRINKKITLVSIIESMDMHFAKKKRRK